MEYKYGFPMTSDEENDICTAEREIKAICKKYNVSLLGEKELWDSEYDTYYTTYTSDFSVISEKYKTRKKEHEVFMETEGKRKVKESTDALREKLKKESPNHRNLSIREEDWDEPNYFGHKPWHTKSLFIDGLNVVKWDLKDVSIFCKNPNGFWQYSKTYRDSDVRVDVSIYIYPEDRLRGVSAYFRPKLYSYWSNICGEFYGTDKTRDELLSQSFVVEMVDRLIELGIVRVV